MPYPHVCHVSMLWILVDLFLMKRLFSQETVFFHYFTGDKNGFIPYRIQVILRPQFVDALFIVKKE